MRKNKPLKPVALLGGGLTITGLLLPPVAVGFCLLRQKKILVVKTYYLMNKDTIVASTCMEKGTLGENLQIEKVSGTVRTGKTSRKARYSAHIVCNMQFINGT